MAKKRTREYFGRVYARIHGGRIGQKTVGIYFGTNELNDATNLAQAILKAVEYGKEVSITLHLWETKDKGKVHITVTSKT